LFQAISFHYYSFAGDGISKGSATEFSDAQYYTTINRAAQIDRVISGHSAVMDAYDPGRRIGLVCDEWGTWWDVEPGTNPGFLHQQNTMRDALVASVHFDIFHAHADRLRMANIAQTVNVLQAMILTDHDGGLAPTPTYHVFEMNKGHHDARRVPLHVVDKPEPQVFDGETLDTITASASTKDGRALISISNLDLDNDTVLTIDIRGRGVENVTGRLLTADKPHSHNTTLDARVVEPTALETACSDGALTALLPRHSFATLELALA
jgi:alpha-N-arabinofuranosidase